MEREVVIKIENVKKQYRLGAIGGGTLQGDLQSWWARIRGKEDPNLKIGQEAYTSNERFYALNGINFEVYKGERLGIIGGNGAGKSTTLKLLSRVTAPTEGNIYIKGRISSMLEVGTGFHPELTGRENIYLNGAILGMSKEEVDSKIEDIIDFSECRQFIDTPVKRYSSGMYVKLAFAVAAHLDSEILIMDEVLAVGDMAFQKKCLNKMEEVSKREGKTVLYVSHNMNTIRQLCDRCIVLSKGSVIFDGDVEDAISLYLNSEENTSTRIEYLDDKRPSWLTSQYIKALSVELFNKDDFVFNHGENVKLLMKWKFLKDVKNVGLRIEICNLDNSPIGTYIIYDFCDGFKNQFAEFLFELDISQFVENTYKTRYTFFNKDAMGNNLNIEYIEGVCFKKSRVNSEIKMVWDVKNWGSIEFEKPSIIKGIITNYEIDKG